MDDTSKRYTLYALTWPIYIEMLLHVLMGNVDVLMLSRYDEGAVASVGIANQIVQMFVMIFGFVTAGTTIVVSQSLGGGLRREASEAAETALALNLAFGAACSAALFAFADRFLSWLGTPDVLMDDALLYMRIVGGFLFLEAVMLTMSAVLRSHGFPRDVMLVSIGMNVVNVVGNYLALYGPAEWPVDGIAGVAAATAVSRGLGVAVMLALLRVRANQPLRLRPTVVFAGTYVRKLLGIGIPSSLEYLAYYASQLLLTSFIVAMGVAALTTRIYLENSIVFIGLFATAIAMGTQIFVSRSIGAGRTEEAFRRCLRSIRIAQLVSFGSALVLCLFAAPAFSLFADNPGVVGTASRLAWWMLAFYPAHSMCMVYQHALKAAGDVKFPATLGIVFMLGVKVPLAWTLAVPFGLELYGVFAAIIADEWIRALIMRRRWRARAWEKRLARDRAGIGSEAEAEASFA